MTNRTNLTDDHDFEDDVDVDVKYISDDAVH